MKSVERKFINISNSHPLWTSYTCFAQVIQNRKFSKRVIYYWFSKLVDCDDYDQSEKYKIVRSLINSQPP